MAKVTTQDHFVVVIPNLGAKAIPARDYSPVERQVAYLVDGSPLRFITPYSRSYSIYLWVNEMAKEELQTRNFDVNEQFATVPLYGPVVFSSWDSDSSLACPLSPFQVQFVLEKLGH